MVRVDLDLSEDDLDAIECVFFCEVSRNLDSVSKIISDGTLLRNKKNEYC